MVNAYHGDLDQVGGRALDRRVHRHPLREAADPPVPQTSDVLELRGAYSGRPLPHVSRVLLTLTGVILLT